MKYVILAILFLVSLSGCAELIGQQPNYYFENVNNQPVSKAETDNRKCYADSLAIPTYGRRVDRDTQKQTYFYACMSNAGWVLHDRNLE
jgi:hypothetical protein